MKAALMLDWDDTRTPIRKRVMYLPLVRLFKLEIKF
jgi:hypothetical protein